jgi:hypothetical protein
MRVGFTLLLNGPNYITKINYYEKITNHFYICKMVRKLQNEEKIEKKVRGT